MSGRKLTADEVAALGLEAPARKLSNEEVSNLNLEAVPTEETMGDKFRAFLRKGSQLVSDVQEAPLRLALNPSAELAPEAPTGAALRKFGHGAGFGFTDELRGVGGAVDELGARASPFQARNVDQQYPDAPLGEALRKRYELERDTARRENDTSQREQPAISTVSEIGGAIAAPNPFSKLAALGRVGRLASAAGAGELYAAGSSRAQDIGGIAKDTAEGGGVGLALQGAIEPVGAAAKYFGNLKEEGADLTEAGISKAATKDFASERGRLGGFSTGTLGDLDRAEAIISNKAATPVQQARAAAFIASPQGIALRQRAYDNLLERLPSRMDELGESRAAMEEAAANATPAAVGAATEKRLGESVLLNQVLPRAERYAQRVVPAAIGSAVGGPVGGGMGALGGAAMGAPGTSLANLLKTPEFMHRAGQVGEAVAGSTAGAAGVAALPASRKLIDRAQSRVGTPEAKSEAARRVAEATGEQPKDKEDVAKKYFLGDGGF